MLHSRQSESIVLLFQTHVCHFLMPLPILRLFNKFIVKNNVAIRYFLQINGLQMNEIDNNQNENHGNGTLVFFTISLKVRVFS